MYSRGTISETLPRDNRRGPAVEDDDERELEAVTGVGVGVLMAMVLLGAHGERW